MRSNTILPVTLAALLLAPVSCQKETPAAAGRVSLIEISPVPEVITKAAVSGTVLPSDRTITLSARQTPASGSPQNYFSAASFSKDGTTWTGGKYWPASGTLDILGYSADGLSVSAAYDSNVAAGVTLTVPDNSSAQTDILWGAVTGQTSGSPVSLGLHHALAALAFNASATDAYDEADNTGITVTDIKVDGVKNSGTVYLKSDLTYSWSSLGTSKDITLPGLGSGYGVPAEPQAIDGSNPFGIGSTGIVVIPQAATSVTVTYTVHKGRDAGGNAVDETGVQGTATLSGSWAAGKKYICTLSFEAERELELSVSVVDWTDDIQNKGISGEVSATYSVSGQTKVTLPDASLTAGGVVYVDWGDGSYDTSNSTAAGTVSLAHSYASGFTGDVSIRVLKGTLDFGFVPSDQYSLFAVNDDTKVLISEKEEFVFTVDGSGKKVKFSPGNLYWDGSAYKFETNEYDYPESWDASHVGHFYWSKDASIARAESYSDGSRSTSDTFFASSGITVSGYSETWTVLSKDEWDYVISNHMGKKQVSIDGKSCAVLVPDGVAASVVESSYTAVAWSTAKEEYGLVALPFAGYRYGTSFTNGGSYGHYWSATPNSSYSANAYYAYFNSSNARTYDSNRNYGRSVRLVSVQ